MHVKLNWINYVFFFIIFFLTVIHSKCYSPDLSDEGKVEILQFRKTYNCGIIDYGLGQEYQDNLVENYFWISFYNCTFFNSDSLDNYVDTFSYVAKSLFDNCEINVKCNYIQVEYLYDYDGTYFEKFYYKLKGDSVIYLHKIYNRPKDLSKLNPT